MNLCPFNLLTMKNLVLDDTLQIFRLPVEYQQYSETFPNVLVMLGRALDAEPLRGQYQPELIEIYLNGDSDPALIWDQGQVVHADPVLLQPHTALVVAVEDIARYIAIGDQVILDDCASLILPDVIFNPTAQAQLLLKLVQEST